MANRRKPTAAWRCDALLNQLSKRGWGELAGGKWQGQRTVLTVLANSFPYGRAEGRITATQIADKAGLSERWVRRLLQEMEQLGLIAWRRGGILRGKPSTSFIQIVKSKIVELINFATIQHDAAIALRRARFAMRLAGVRKTTNAVEPTVGIKKQDYKYVGHSHAELDSSLPYQGKGTTRLSGVVDRTVIEDSAEEIPLKELFTMMEHRYRSNCDCTTCSYWRKSQEHREELKRKQEEERKRELEERLARQKAEEEQSLQDHAAMLKARYPHLATSKERALAWMSEQSAAAKARAKARAKAEEERRKELALAF
ncbi:hypothetical protein [Boudabousia marimammalium]|uniref:Uncharacterized protein n=1 Tax=Boudabousia marimammalium TaxID=156892 RepID=A0A1Q5PP63_9ACTO|nr:hypothetical protein [Boudabousia marimammalium]OKL49302.1 hypothetical protein BM477_04795 [Boudabousia marimammalium]